MTALRKALHGAGTRRREAGSALLIAVLMLVLIGMMGLASLDTVTADRKVAGFDARKRVSLDAADAGVQTAISDLTTNFPYGGTTSDYKAFTVTLPPTTLGTTSSFPNGQPEFEQDPPNASQPYAVVWDGTGPSCASRMFSAVQGVGGGSVQFYPIVYDINVQGVTATGITTRVQAQAVVCIAKAAGGGPTGY